MVQFASGAISAGCHHNSCQGKGWRELRALVEDGVTPSVGSQPASLEQIFQAELRTTMDQLAEELKQEIRTQFESLSS